MEGELHRSDDLRDALKKMWTEGAGDMYLQSEEDEMPMLYFALEDGWATAGLPSGDLLPDNITLGHHSETLLGQAGFERPETDDHQTYRREQEVTTLEDMTALFAQTCTLAREAHGYDPVECGYLEVEW